MNTRILLLAFTLLLATPVMAEAPRDIVTVPDVIPDVPVDTCQQWCKPYWASMPKEEYVFFVAEAADMLTTLDIKNHPELEEQNPFLGKHPSDAKIIGLCLFTALAHSTVTYILVDGDAPKGVVKAWEYLTIAIESGAAYHNYRMGLRFTF